MVRLTSEKPNSLAAAASAIINPGATDSSGRPWRELIRAVPQRIEFAKWAPAANAGIIRVVLFERQVPAAPNREALDLARKVELFHGFQRSAMPDIQHDVRCASAKKKPPESPCPRGAKDTDSSGSDWTLGAARGGKLVLCSKRPARFHAGGSSLRGPQEDRRRGLPGCGPTHVDRWLVDARFALAFAASIRPRVRSGDGENMTFPNCGQERFPPMARGCENGTRNAGTASCPAARPARSWTDRRRSASIGRDRSSRKWPRGTRAEYAQDDHRPD